MPHRKQRHRPAHCLLKYRLYVEISFSNTFKSNKLLFRTRMTLLLELEDSNLNLKLDSAWLKPRLMACHRIYQFLIFTGNIWNACETRFFDQLAVWHKLFCFINEYNALWKTIFFQLLHNRKKWQMMQFAHEQVEWVENYVLNQFDIIFSSTFLF